MSTNESPAATGREISAPTARRGLGDIDGGSPGGHFARVAQAPPELARTAAYPAGAMGLPRAFWFLWVGTLVNRLGGGVLPFLAVYLTTARHFSVTVAGGVVASHAAGCTLAGPVGGVLADRYGRRLTLLGGTCLAGATMLALGFARSAAAVATLAFLLGFFTDLCRPAMSAAVADIVPPADRRRAYGLLYWAINLGFAAAASFAGLLAAWSFTWLFVVDALTTLAFGVVIFAAVPETMPPRPSTESLFTPTNQDANGLTTGRRPAGRGTLVARDLLFPFTDRRFVTFAALQLLVLLVFHQLGVALPLDMVAHGLDPMAIGQLMASNGFVIVLVQPLALRLTNRWAQHGLLAIGALLTGVGFGIAALAGGREVFLAAIVVLTLGEIGFAMAIPVVLAQLAPEHRRASYQGAYMLVGGLAAMVAPPLGTLVLGRAGAVALWLGCLVTGLLAAALHLAAGRRVQQR